MPPLCRVFLGRIVFECVFCDDRLITTIKELIMGLSTLLIILLVLILLGALPVYPYSRNWGYGPSGGLTLVVVVILILALTGNI
jgi:hypothetical protein